MKEGPIIDYGHNDYIATVRGHPTTIEKIKLYWRTPWHLLRALLRKKPKVSFIAFSTDEDW